MSNFQKTFDAATRNPDNWRKDGIDWNFVDADVYESMSIFYDGKTYMEMFDKCADKWEAKYPEVCNYKAYRKMLVQ